jgi:hypothetical protein
MVAVLLALATFPDAPLADQVAIGRSVATKEPRMSLRDLFRAPEPRSRVTEVLGKDKVDVGWWSNGYTKVPVEHVVWLSPGLVSRWLGFLEAREYWPQGELDKRWSYIDANYGDRRAFIVQLTAYPKLPTYGIGEYKRTTAEEIENVRFVYTSGERSERMEAVRLAQWQSREREDLEDFPWWHFAPFGGQLIGEFEQYVAEEPLPLGDYHRAWYLLWAEGDDAQFEVRILSRRKERVAKFGRAR